MMDPGFAFWILASVLFSGVTAGTVLGWREVRRGNLERHRRWMNLSAVLVGLFLLLYVAKVLVLGREDLSRWSLGSLTVLRIHEAFVAVMLASTTGARLLARRLQRPETSARDRRLHRTLGRLGATSCLLAFLTALIVLREIVRQASP